MGARSKNSIMIFCDYCKQLDYCTNVSPICDNPYYAFYLCGLCKSSYGWKKENGSIRNALLEKLNELKKANNV